MHRTAIFALIKRDKKRSQAVYKGITTFSLLNRLPYISNRGIVVFFGRPLLRHILFVFTGNILCISLSMSFSTQRIIPPNFPFRTVMGVGFGGCISLNFLSFSTLSRPAARCTFRSNIYLIPKPHRRRRM